jgi:hypothetical protein
MEKGFILEEEHLLDFMLFMADLIDLLFMLHIYPLQNAG